MSQDGEFPENDHRVMSVGIGRGRGNSYGGQERRELRRPIDPHWMANQQMPTQDGIEQQQGYIDVSRSTLNATAEEFVPSWLRQTSPAANTQSKENNVGPDDALSYTLCHIQDMIVEMTLNPGKFDSLAMPLVRFLNSRITDEHTHKEVVDMIFEQSVMEPNFRYNGARLCNILSHYLSPNLPGGDFKSVLLERCRKENQKAPTLISNNSDRLFGFAYFLGELYTHLDLNVKGAQQSGATHRITILASALLTLLNAILHNQADLNVKCVCQILKFTGSSLEDEVALKGLLDEVMLSLQRVALAPNISPYIQQMTVKVIELRDCNWGRGTTVSVNQQQQQHNAQQEKNEPVFYGPDGQELTAEESHFIEQQLSYLEDEDNCGNWSTNDGDMDDGMNEEMMAAYDEFLLQQPNHK